MKHKVPFLLTLAMVATVSLQAQLNVGSTAAADASAILQATSTTKGFLPPVMTTTQINAIILPANGLTVYNTTLSQLQVNVGTPLAPSWAVGAGGANVYWSQLGNTGTVPGTNYVGTTDNASLAFGTNNAERVRIDSSTGFVGIGTTTPHAPLQFAATLTNRKIVLWDGGTNVGNDSSFYGFGINPSTLRYQVPTGGNHSFYNNKTLVANVGGTGTINSYGAGAGFFSADRTRSGVSSGVYGSGGYTRIFQSQGGDGILVDSLGNTTTNGSLTVANTYTTSVAFGTQLQTGLKSGVGSKFGTFFRINTGGGGTSSAIVTLDAVAGDNSVRKSLILGTNQGSNPGKIILMSSLGVADTTDAVSYVWNGANMTIGANYKANGAATNGLLVEGNVGIGTGATSPQASLDVASNMRLGTTVSGTSTDSILTINSSTGIINKRSLLSVNSNIYNSDGTLTAARTMQLNGNALTFNGASGGLAAGINILSGSSGAWSQLGFGRTGTEGTIGITAQGNQILNAAATGDMLIYTGANSLQMGSNGAGAVVLSTGANEHFRITPAGLIGINTSAPTHNLEISGSAGIIGTNSLQFGSGVTGQDGAAGRIGYQTYTAGALDIVGAGTSGSNRIVKLWDNVTVPGTMGIGTATPAAKLQVISADNTFTTNIIDAQANNLTTGTSLFYQGIRMTGSNANNPLYLDGKGTGAIFLNANTGTGNVGIRTTSPAATLDVAGNMRIATTATAPNSDDLVTINGSGILSRRTVASLATQTPDVSIYSTDGTLAANRTVQLGGHTLTFNGTAGGFNGGVSLLSGAGQWSTLSLGRTGIEGSIGIAASGNQILNAAAAGDMLLWTGSNSLQMGANGSGAVVLSTGANEHFRLASNGNVGINNNNPSQALTVGGNIKAGGDNYGSVVLTQGGGSNAGYLAFFKGDGTTRLGYIGYDNNNLSYNAENGAVHSFTGGNVIVGSALGVRMAPSYTIDVSGNVRSSFDMNASAFNLTSDRRLKKNLVPLNSALDKVMQLMPYSYEKKATLAATSYDQKEMGFIAQDVRKIFPDLITVGKDADKILAINYLALIPLLTKAIQEQQAQNNTQVVQIADLKQANVAMTAQNDIQIGLNKQQQVQNDAQIVVSKQQQAQIEIQVVLTKQQAAEVASLIKENLIIAAQLADIKELKIAMAQLRSELNKTSVTQVVLPIPVTVNKL